MNPSLCAQGLTVSVFIKVGSDPQNEDYKFLLGNINTEFSKIEEHTGFAVGVKGDKFEIFVISHKHVCYSDRVNVRKNLWSHLVFSWKDSQLQDGALEIFVDSSRVHPTSIDCDSNRENRSRTLLPQIKIGSQRQQLSITAEFDHLAIWYNNFQFNVYVLAAPWIHVRGIVYFDFTLVEWNEGEVRLQVRHD